MKIDNISENFLLEYINKMLQLTDLNEDEKLFNLLKQMIIICYQFINENFSKKCKINIRNLTYFKDLYEFFKQSIQDLYNNNNSNKNNTNDDISDNNNFRY